MKIILKVLLICLSISGYSQTVIKAKDAGIKDYKSVNDGGEFKWSEFKTDIGKYSASSFLAPSGKVNYDPSNLNDFNLNTSWCEGKPDYGIGEYIEVELYSSSVVSFDKEGFRGEFYLMNGMYKSQQGFTDNSRVKRMKAYFNGQYLCDIDLLDLRSFQTFNLYSLLKTKHPKNGDKIRFVIEDVYAGVKYKDVVITELIGVYAYDNSTATVKLDQSSQNLFQDYVGHYSEDPQGISCTSFYDVKANGMTYTVEQLKEGSGCPSKVYDITITKYPADGTFEAEHTTNNKKQSLKGSFVMNDDNTITLKIQGEDGEIFYIKR